MNIRVAGLDFSLEANDLAMSEVGLYAETQHVQQKIVYSTLYPQDRQREAVLHEVIHAVMAAYGPPETARSDEDIARALGTGLTQVFMDNPDLVKFLYGEGG